MYKPTDKQFQLIRSNTQIQRLSYLQKNSLTRLQHVYHKGRIYIKSINDQYKLLRVIISGLLAKIFMQFNQFNSQVLEKLKNIFYTSKLIELQKNKGLQPQKLLKNIAIHFNKIQVGSQSQNQILKLFNTISFFDEVIMRSVIQYANITSSQITYQFCQKLLIQNFNIKLECDDKHPKNENITQLFVTKFNNQILRYSYKQIFESNDDYDSISQITLSNNKMLIAISNESSPTRNRNTKKQIMQLNVFNENIDNSNKKAKHKKSRRASNTQRSFLWGIFCCNFE